MSKSLVKVYLGRHPYFLIVMEILERKGKIIEGRVGCYKLNGNHLSPLNRITNYSAFLVPL